MREQPFEPVILEIALKTIIRHDEINFPRSIINDFRPMNAIFAVEVRQESDFACRAIRLPLCNASFFSFGRTATDFLPPRFGNVSSSMRDREIGCAPSTPWARGKNLSQRCRMRVSPFLFPFYSLPSSLFHPNSPLFPRFPSLFLDLVNLRER